MADRDRDTEARTDIVDASADEPVTSPIDAPSTGGSAQTAPYVPAKPAGEPDTELSLIEAAKLQAQHRSKPALRGGAGASSIPGYRILRELHRGGQGVVYLAIQEGTRRKVAIKVMREGPFSGPGDRVRFEREVQVLAQINNANIVGILDSGVSAGSYYYVMDFVGGYALDEWNRHLEPSHDEILKLFGVICEAVNAAHLRGVIHRDLKPSNVRVTPQGVPKILDFGLAKVADSAEVNQGYTVATAMTATGQFVGSLPWSSPEQARGEGDKIDVRTDVYALGVMLYQLICGQFPYRIDGPMAQVVDSITKTDPARPRSLNKQISSDLESLLLKPLAKQREYRYQTAGEFARDIQRYLQGEPVEAKRGSAQYLIRKLLGRYWVAASIAAAVVIIAPLAVAAGILLTASSADTDAVRRQNEGLIKRIDDLSAELEEAQRERDDLRERLRAAGLSAGGG